MRNEEKWFGYRVTWDFDGEDTVSKGLVNAENFADAVAKIDMFYDSIIDLALEIIVSGKILDLDSLCDWIAWKEKDSGIDVLGPLAREAVRNVIQAEE